MVWETTHKYTPDSPVSSSDRQVNVILWQHTMGR